MAKKRIKVAVICGGPSSEREVSLKSGEQVFLNLPKKYEKFLIEINKEGAWLLKENDSRQRFLTIIHPEKGFAGSDLKKFDVAFLALHGKFGEDGKIQAMLDVLDVSYTGSGVLASALGMDKLKTMEIAGRQGINVPRYFVLSSREKIGIKLLKNRIKKEIGYPCVIKPNDSGSSIGVSIIKSPGDLGKAIKEASRESGEIIIQEFIGGRELSCGVIGNPSDGDIVALPSIEIITGNKFFDYEAKYFSEKTREISPAGISERLEDKIREQAKKVHQALGCAGLSRSDFILKKGKFYFLEINTSPGMTEKSLCPKEAKAAGMNFSKFLDEQVKLALKKR